MPPIPIFRFGCLRRAALIGLLVPIVFGITSHPARAQCTRWEPGLFDEAVVGSDTTIRAMTVWDPDGGGPSPPLLVVAGSFHTMNGVTARHLAVWDGLVWRSLGAGPSGSIFALAVYNGQLVAAGTQSSGNQIPDVEVWNGSSWTDIGFGHLVGAPDTVFALASYGGSLIAAGHFGGVSSTNIATWNGSSWQAFAGGGLGGSVYCMTVSNNVLFAGGGLFAAGGTSVKYVARYDGSSWSAVSDGTGNGPTQPVLTMAMHGTDLFVGVAEPSASGALRWSGTSWQSAGSICRSVYAFAESGGLLYAGGDFFSELGCSLNRIALWNGSSWSNVGPGIDPTLAAPSLYVRALCSYNGTLFAGGAFNRGGTTTLNNIGQWTGSAWVAPDAPVSIYALGAYGSKLAIGGYFSQLMNYAEDYYLCTWDGNVLAPLGGGINAPVDALKGYSDQVQGQTRNNLVVGGGFTQVGALAANHVALWSESPVFPFNAWSTLGSGFDNTVLALEQFGGATVAGGAFLTSGATSVNRVARWSGSAWQAMGTGMNGAVHALKAYIVAATSIALVAGGEFTIANGGAATRIAIWTQSTTGPGFTPWTAMGGGFNDTVFAIERYNGSTYAAGAFTSGSAVFNHMARWNGSSWVSVGSTPGGGCNGTVYALKSDGGYLYALGHFTSADGVSALNVARWNGSVWSALDAGVNLPGRALLPFNGEMIAGGSFTVPAPGMARFLETGAPWISSQPVSRTASAGQSTSLTLTVASGYESSTYAWRKDGVPVTDGTTPWGSQLYGTWSDLLDIYNCAPADSGLYDCVVSNGCGSVTSQAATLTVNGSSGVPGDGTGGIALAVQPNPAPGATTIDLKTQQPTRVVIAVYDGSGRELRRLLNGMLAAGTRRLTWDGRDDRGERAGAGVYFLRATLDGRSLIRRIALIR